MKTLGAPSCRHFNGYKPCGIVDSHEIDCSKACSAYEEHAAIHGTRILIVHLGALGAVARSTSLLPAIKRKYKQSHITWVTDKPGDLILKANPFVDRILTSLPLDLLKLKALHFDVAFVIDKSLEAAGVLQSCGSAGSPKMKVFGFRASPVTGAIEPATAAASELWEIGISNRLKFDVNRKTENELVHQALELGPFQRDEYVLCLTEDERRLAKSRQQLWSHGFRRQIVGFNTGCAPTIAAKKLSVDGHVSLMKEISLEASRRSPGHPLSFVLLGGREDTERNQAIAHKVRGLGIEVFQSQTADGIRDGMASIEAVDLVVSGDSFGLHLAIGLRKKTVAWFGPTCAHEIDLYDRGDVIQTLAGCSPCWKRSCSMTPMCYDLVDFRQMARAAVSRLIGTINVQQLEDSPSQALEVLPGL
jgi:heptosyltransferase-2